MTHHYPQRKSPRLQGYDYAQAGAYFVTLCAHQRAHVFGDICDGVMVLNESGRIAEAHWVAIPDHHPGVELDGFVVMPNHMHGIIVIMDREADNAGVVPTEVSIPSLGVVVGSYKSGVTRRIRQMYPDLILWQRRYHDHIIRNEADLHRIREYVVANPARWYDDTFYT